MQIRDSTLSDLQPASNLILQAFHSDPSPVSMYHIGLFEFRRLRSNFPYWDRNRARMLVAELPKSEEVVGFCFLDDRPPTPFAYFKNNPRPMLTDVVVDRRVRRQGIARRMLEVCEDITVLEFRKASIYLRVLKDNEAAKNMYLDMGYAVLEPSIPGDPPEVLMMVKDLRHTAGQKNE